MVIVRIFLFTAELAENAEKNHSWKRIKTHCLSWEEWNVKNIREFLLLHLFEKSLPTSLFQREESLDLFAKCLAFFRYNFHISALCVLCG
jgi:hypothetical protein